MCSGQRLWDAKISAMLVQEGDPYPEWPDDAEVPAGESEVQFRLAAAETIKGRGNELFKQVRALHQSAKWQIMK